MRKIILVCAAVAFSAVILLELPASVRQETKTENEETEFKLYSSISNTAGGVRSTDLFVIADYEDPEQTIKEVEQFFNNMNGIPNQLTIHLYRREEDLHNDVGAYVWEHDYD